MGTGRTRKVLNQFTRGVAAAGVLLGLPWVLHAFDRAVEFNRDVRPILSDKCFTCHGPDSVRKGAPFRLDIEASAKGDLGGRRAIVPGDPASSELLKRVTADEARRMPPAWSGLKLVIRVKDRA